MLEPTELAKISADGSLVIGGRLAINPERRVIIDGATMYEITDDAELRELLFEIAASLTT